MGGSPQYSFHIFRYQILPVSQQLPLFLSDEISTIEELKAKKNELFFETLHSINKFVYSRADLIHKNLYRKNEISVFKIGVNRILNREKPDFTEEEVDNWPNMLIIFNNDEKIQKVAIQFRRKAFSDTKTVARLLEQNINNLLSKYYLSVHFKPIFTKNYFWDLVETYQEKSLKLNLTWFLLTCQIYPTT